MENDAIKSEQATATSTNRIPALDGVRGIAILLVLVHHFSGIPSAHIGLPTAVDREWIRFASIGWTGVDLFFVLSGFLITSILYDAKGPAGEFFKNFYARRGIRIFPVYYAMLAFLLFVLPWVMPSQESASATLRENQLVLWLYVLNIKTFIATGWLAGASHLVGHLWSLCIEEQFYLVWPLIVFSFGRRSLIAIAGMLVVAAFVIRFFLILNIDSGLQIFVFPLARMDALAVGAGIALLVRSQRDRAFLKAVVWPLMGISFIGLVVLFFYNDARLIPYDARVLLVGFSLLAGLFGGLVAAVVLAPPESRLSRTFSWRPLTVLGKYSYAIYVIHFPVVQLVVRQTDFASDIAVWAGFQLPGIFAVAIVSSAITFGLALLSWRLLETPFLNLRSRFSAGNARMSWSD